MYSAAVVFMTAGWFFGFPTELVPFPHSTAAMLPSLCPSCHTGGAVQSFLLHPRASPRRGAGDTEGMGRGLGTD